MGNIYIKLVPNQPQMEAVYKREEENVLDFFYREIECDCIDIVNAIHLPEGLCMIVDDEGLFKDGAKANMHASVLYGFFQHQQFIVGNALICKSVFGEDGYETVGFEDEEEAKKVANELLEINKREIVNNNR